MRWRRVLVGGGSILGAAATYNAIASRGLGPLGNPLGGEERWYEWKGHRIAYTVRGSGPPVVLVHSLHAAAWSYEWARVVPLIADHCTVYALDLLGFGASDRPAMRYTASLYTHLLGDFATDVVRGPCTLIGSSLGAAYAIVAAAGDAARFPAVVLVAPTGLVRLTERPTAAGEFARMVLASPVIGTAAFNTRVSRTSLRNFLEPRYADRRCVTAEMIDAYYMTSHQQGAVRAAASFLTGGLNVDVRRALRRLLQPGLLVWGASATASPVEDARGFVALKPSFKVAIFDRAGDLPHDERPEQFARAVNDFVTRALP